MDIKLVVEQGRTSIRTLRLHSSQTLIGRAHGCQVRIPSALVSRRHCLLDVCDGIVTVEDLNSRNGTLLNGETVTGQRLVRPGDHLQIGPITFIVEYLMSAEALHRLLQAEKSREDVESVELEIVEEDEELDVLEEIEDGPLPVDSDMILQESPDPQVRDVEEEAELLVFGEPADPAEEQSKDRKRPELNQFRQLLTGLDDESNPPPQSPRQGSNPLHSSAIICVCKKCQTLCYVLGVNALVVTLEDAVEFHRKTGTGMAVGASPTNDTDLIGLLAGTESWPDHKPSPPPKDTVSSAVIQHQNRQFRRWECKDCKTVQEYPWCAAGETNEP